MNTYIVHVYPLDGPIKVARFTVEAMDDMAALDEVLSSIGSNWTNGVRATSVRRAA